MGSRDIAFPNLNIYLENVPKRFEIFGVEIALYGVVISIGMLLAILLVNYVAKKSGQNADMYWDLALVTIAVGVVGARLDHTLGNVSSLLYLDSLGKKGYIIDDYSEMEIVSNKPAYIENSFSFFSLLNISGTAKRVTMKNAKYPLNDGEISCEYQYGISNEVVGEIAEISIREGKLLLIKVL